ncbi:MAG: TrmB family transcriptional regulator [Candidatus Nanoarchaeia archaeon]
MNPSELEQLGLNRNEAKVYYALLQKGQATAAELVKALGIHRNIVYDNLDKLIEKGLVSFVNEGTKKKFVAEKPEAIIEFLESKKENIDHEIKTAKTFLPEISKILGVSKGKQEATIFRGVAGLKKIQNEIGEAEVSWCIGITNESVKILGETYWKNYNLKMAESGRTEYLLWNSNYTNTVIPNKKNIHSRILPPELDQVTETIMYEDKVAIMVYSENPIVIVIENKAVFDMHKKHFDFLWKLSKNRK